jgi:hypothetical protein
MTTRISSTGDLTAKEWEALSAYLDEKLNTQENAAWNKRLEEDPHLRYGLEELRRTRNALQELPKMRAPRNFTLTPEMAGLRPGVRSLPPAYPVLRLASVLATIFFVLLSVSQVMVVGNNKTSVLLSESRQVVTSEVSSEMLSGPSFGKGGGDADNVGAESAPEEAEAPPASTEAPPPVAPLAFAPEQPTQALLEKMEGENPQATSETGSLVVTPLGLPLTSTPMVKMEVADQAAPVTEEISAQIITTEGVSPQPGVHKAINAATWGWSFLETLQVLLAFLAVGTGLAAIWLRRSSHG